MGRQVPVLTVVGAFAIALLKQDGRVTAGRVGMPSKKPNREAVGAQSVPRREGSESKNGKMGTEMILSPGQCSHEVAALGGGMAPTQGHTGGVCPALAARRVPLPSPSGSAPTR